MGRGVQATKQYINPKGVTKSPPHPKYQNNIKTSIAKNVFYFLIVYKRRVKINYRQIHFHS